MALDFKQDGYKQNQYKKMIMASSLLDFFSSSAFLWAIFGSCAFFGLTGLLSLFIFQKLKKQGFMKRLSLEEKSALFAGELGSEKEFFNGNLNLKKWFGLPPVQLSLEEQKFLDEPTDQLCLMSDEWALIQRKKLKAEVEDFLKKEKFFGLLIPKEYGGRGFSKAGLARVIEKIASHNIPLSVIVMVPNSIGPAGLLSQYGTKEQKAKYLPRLAEGKDLPCFALTEDQAGSDAASIRSQGVLFKEKGELKIRLHFHKRWISLGARADLLALAVQLKDPQKLYSDKTDLGIGVVLVESQAKGIARPLFHDTMGLPFYNGSLSGQGAVVSAEQALIGGLEQIGKGWGMIMSALAKGRGISIPALATACGKKTARLTGDWSFVRHQFKRPIGAFEGVQENLAHIAGASYMMSAAQERVLSDLSQKPSPIISSMAKYHLTEMARTTVQKGMDIMAGAGLSLGPKNKIASLYTALPLAITVEGSNLLIRTFIIYGQGLLRAQAAAARLMSAIEQSSFKKFYFAFLQLSLNGFKHGAKAFILSLSQGFLFISPSFLFSKEHRYLQKLKWAGALFAFLSDLNMLLFGARLKTKGRLCGDFADLLASQYTAGALLWHWRKSPSAQNCPSHWLAVKWGLDYSFYQIQKSFVKILRDYPSCPARFLLKPLLLLLRINPLGFETLKRLNKKIAQALKEDEPFRKKLFENMYHPKDPEDTFKKLDKARALSLKEERILNKIKKPGAKRLPAEEALKTNRLLPEEKEILKSAIQARREAIQVSAFTDEEYFGKLK